MPEKPHTCTICRKFWFSYNGGCTTTGISEKRLRVCGALGSVNEISSVVEGVSFDDTLGEIGRVADEGLSGDWVIPIGTVEMYEVIVDFGGITGPGKMAQVDTKYKIVDRKVRPVLGTRLLVRKFKQDL